MRSTRIDAIQGLRAVAALLVVVDHAISTLVIKAGFKADLEPAAWLLGGMGVKIFFLISGFIMMITTHQEFATERAPRRFLGRRLIRVAPVYWLVTFIYVAKILAQGVPVSAGYIITSLLFFPVRNEAGLIEPVYGLGWTLNYEMFFYLLFATALWFRLHFGVVLLVGVLCSLVLFGGDVAGWVTSEWIRTVFEFCSNSIVLYFAGGVGIALLRLRLLRQGLLLKIPFNGVLALSVVIIAAYVTWTFLSVTRSGEAPSVTLFCLLPVMICSWAIDEGGTHPIRTMACRLGDASYSIYLTHSFLIGPLGRLWGATGLRQSVIFFVILAIFGCSALGLIVFRFVERPLLGFFKRNLRALAVV